MSVRAGGAEEMFLDVKELAVHKLRIRKTYAPGSIDFHSAEIKQIEPLEVTATAELLEGQIRIEGNLETKIELVCARCLEPVVEEVRRPAYLFHDRFEAERTYHLDLRFACPIAPSHAF